MHATKQLYLNIYCYHGKLEEGEHIFKKFSAVLYFQPFTCNSKVTAAEISLLHISCIELSERKFY